MNRNNLSVGLKSIHYFMSHSIKICINQSFNQSKHAFKSKNSLKSVKKVLDTSSELQSVISTASCGIKLGLGHFTAPASNLENLPSKMRHKRIASLRRRSFQVVE